MLVNTYQYTQCSEWGICLPPMEERKRHQIISSFMCGSHHSVGHLPFCLIPSLHTSLTLAFPSSFPLSMAVLPVVCCTLTRCFPHAIVRLFLKRLLRTDAPVSFPWLKVLSAQLRKEQLALWLLSFWSKGRAGRGGAGKRKNSHKWPWSLVQIVWKAHTWWMRTSLLPCSSSLLLPADVSVGLFFLLRPVLLLRDPNLCFHSFCWSLPSMEHQPWSVPKYFMTPASTLASSPASPWQPVLAYLFVIPHIQKYKRMGEGKGSCLWIGC